MMKKMPAISSSDYLTQKGYEVKGAGTLNEARARVNEGVADIILLDVQLPDGFGTDLLRETASMPLRPPIIMITAHGDIDMAVESMKNGAHDFLQKPIQLDQLEQSIQRASELVATAAGTESPAPEPARQDRFRHRSIPAMLSVIARPSGLRPFPPRC